MIKIKTHHSLADHFVKNLFYIKTEIYLGINELLLKTEITRCCLEKYNFSGIFIPIPDHTCSFGATEF